MPLYKDKRLGRGVILWKIEPTHSNDSVQIDIFVDYKRALIVEKSWKCGEARFLTKNKLTSSKKVHFW